MLRWHGCLRGLGSSLAGSLLLLGGAPALSGAQARPKTAPDSQTVVFVCEHGTVKSVVALAWFRQLAGERHLDIRAISRGTAPDSGVPARVREGLRLDGLTLGPFTPARFTLADLASAITVISFDQPTVAEMVGGRVPSARWDGLPAVSEDYRIARDSIRHRVALLVDSLDHARRNTSKPAPALAAQGPDWNAVETAMGRPAVTQPPDVHRFNFPRSDLEVMVGGVKIKPALALGGWVAFTAHGTATVAMGDLVLTSNELAPVLRRLQQGGIEQSAIHHHLVGESPRVLYMHIHGHGDPVQLATTIRAAVALTGAPPPAAAPMGANPVALDTAEIARTIGTSGRVNGGVYQISVPRAESIREGDFEIPTSMGLGTAINFQPTDSGRAAITGDFVLLGSEVNPVIRALTENGIEPTSLHNHLLEETPRLFFLHFWAHADAAKLARGLRAALDRTNSRRPTQ